MPLSGSIPNAGILELEANLDKEPEYVEARRQQGERQLEKKEWQLGALPDAFSPLYMVDGRYTTRDEEAERQRQAKAPPVQDMRLPYDYHLEVRSGEEGNGSRGIVKMVQEGRVLWALISLDTLEVPET